MKAAIIVLAALTAMSALAADCPTPKLLTCEQLLTKAKQRNCLPKEKETVVPCAIVPCISSPCISVPCQTVPCTPQIVEKIVPISVKPPVPRGNWFAGAGPLYSRGWGVEAVAGYKWANGWMVMGGPTWINHDPYGGTVTNCGKSKCQNRNCTTLPYSVAPGSSWGGTALVLYNWK